MLKITAGVRNTPHVITHQVVMTVSVIPGTKLTAHDVMVSCWLLMLLPFRYDYADFLSHVALSCFLIHTTAGWYITVLLFVFVFYIRDTGMNLFWHTLLTVLIDSVTSFCIENES